jgi:LysR family transcriptional regulator, regulator for genes of the gallate degradation pathway
MARARATPIEAQLHNLSVLICVADTESISRAAEQLCKVPSTVTRSILDLERTVGVALFERRPRGMLLNAYGEAVLVRARRIREEIRHAVEELQESRKKSGASSVHAIATLLFSDRRLQLLVELDSLRSIAAAGARMGMTQAGASMALARMEASLGQVLFRRAPDGLVPLLPAERLSTHAKLIFAELRHIESDLSAIAGNVAGEVVVGATPLGRTAVLPTAIATAIARYPRLRVTTVDSSYDRLVASLRSGEIDFVFGALRLRHLCQGLITEPLFIDRLAVLVRRGHTLAGRTSIQLAELLQEKWILPRTMGRPLIDASFETLGLQPPVPSVEAGEPSIIRQLLRASDMLAVSSPNQLKFEIETGALAELPVTLEGTIREVGLIVRDGAKLPPAALALLEAVRAQVHTRGERD